MSPVSFEELLSYWLGELAPEREAFVEERLFEDGETARRLEAIARLDIGVVALIRAGRLQSGVSVETVDALRREGTTVRTYGIAPGETVRCTIADEDLLAIRLKGDFGAADHVDVVMEGTLEGTAGLPERYDGVLVDRASGEVVLVYPGDRVRALPRSQFLYRVTGDGGRTLGEFRLDHTPRPAV
jgi:hypothetical protein